ncbi:JAB domain-containing protein [Muricauda sp. SCSIO 64092]|uniref:JAB domain-containing protein n=1 Tax=Allomuricauda sp. SCSIO 64092 TaxID=2908842 RepID=UPI001FF63399|nr:JAB domain-containing protein [Muricauda sp. SCSIO 64092]UOY05005.1 JAB domain-containing protein [Muricauda sp. SCSIO 64092]
MKTALPSTELLGSSKIQIQYQRPHVNEMHHISCAEDANEVLRKYIDPAQLDVRECFWVILLTASNRVLGISEVAKGSTLGVQMNPKYIFQLALLTNAVYLIISHTHPSGNLTISRQDIELTKNIKRAARLMEMTLLDHIIITSESFVSFAQEGEL